VKTEEIIRIMLKTSIPNEDVRKLILQLPRHQIIQSSPQLIELYEEKEGPANVSQIVINEEDITFPPNLFIAISTHFAQNRIDTSIREIGKEIKKIGVAAQLEDALEIYSEMLKDQVLSNPIAVPDTYKLSAG
jgi:hypothetical protein